MEITVLKARIDRKVEDREDIDRDIYDYSHLADGLLWRAWEKDKPQPLTDDQRAYLARAVKRQRALYNAIAQRAQVKELIELLSMVPTTAAAYGLPEQVVRDGILSKLRPLVGLAN